MKHHDQDRLLSEALGGERLEAFRQATLECGLDALRRRRRRRRIVRACALACVPLLGVFTIVLLKNLSSPESLSNSESASVPGIPVPNRNQAIKIITDDELFALFPNRSMALVGKPGHQQLVFLDQPRTIGEPSTQ